MSGSVTAAIERLCAAERARREAIDGLIRLGAVRSRRLVADLGEALAAGFYGVPLAKNTSQPGYDLVTRDGRRVQVRALRNAPHYERGSMGVMKDPYDVLFAVKFSVDYVRYEQSKSRARSLSGIIPTEPVSRGRSAWSLTPAFAASRLSSSRAGQRTYDLTRRKPGH